MISKCSGPSGNRGEFQEVNFELIAIQLNDIKQALFWGPERQVGNKGFTWKHRNIYLRNFKNKV